MMNSLQKAERRAGWNFLLVFALLVAGILAAGHFYFRHYERNFRGEVERQLSAIVELKVDELTRWREECMADGAIFFKNPSFSALVRRFLAQPADADAQRQLLDWLGKFPTIHGHDQVSLMDAQGVTRLSVPGGLNPATSDTLRVAAEVLRSGQVVLQDFYRHEIDHRVHLQVLVPILDDLDARRPLGVLVLRIDPETYLYPFLKHWPTPSRTAETLLTRREGNEVVFLNELRFQTNTALNLRLPLDRVANPAVQAALGRKGIMEGIDYRGVPVVAAVRAIPDSPWALVARMDTAEVYAPMRERLREVIVLIGALLLGAGGCVGWVWRQQRVRFYQERAAAAAALREINEHLETRVTERTAELEQANRALQVEIAERKSAEEAVKHERQRLYDVLETLPVSVVLLSADHRVPFANRFFREQFGESQGWRCHEYLFHRDAPCEICETYTVLKTAAPHRWAWTGPDNRDYDIFDFPFTGEDGAALILEMGIDITERKRAEEALQEAHHELEQRVVERTEELRRANEELQTDITERKRAEEALEQSHAAALSIMEDAIAARDQAEQANAALRSEMAERKQAEESCARLAMAVEHAAESIMITDEHGVILYVNPAFEKTTRYTREEAIGQNPRLLRSGKHDAEFYRRMWAALTAGQIWHGGLINKRKDGTLYEEEANISPVRSAAGKIVNYVAVKRDVTEQKKLEAQARRTQRLESIGTLAGGVAHDLNNALAPIMLASEMLRLEFPDTAASYLELIQSSAQRGADMVKQLLTFAKGTEGELLLLQPQHLLKEMEKLIENTFLKGIELRTHYPKDLWTILGDATQLHQVLLNLCVNARDAMPGGGTLTLEAENQELAAAYAGTVPEAKPGRYVLWRVTDTGTGIPPEILDRIFDPFFTTKGPDKGTGLGLCTTLGIVKGHGGFIRVYSTPGQGSTFAVYLPAYGAGDTALLTKTDTGFRGHGETILVVDDDDAVRTVLRAVLTKFNFKVLTADDGADALIQVAEHPTELRAVITDLHMPHMDGLSFVRVLKGRLPRAGIIAAGGRMEEQEENEFKQLGVHAVIQKPFTQEKLVEALKTVFQE